MPRKKKEEVKNEGAGMMRWLLTYADMITLLLALFIILFSISSINKVKYQALARDVSGGFNHESAANNPPGGSSGAHSGGPDNHLKAIQVQLSSYIRKHHLDSKVKTRVDHRGLVISLLTDKALYDSGSAELRPQTRAILDEVYAFLKKSKDELRVEGFTDNVPISTPWFPTNWELSTARASTVTRYLVEQDHLAPERISASGYGEWRPINDNLTEEHRQLNRRVDIVVLSGHLSETDKEPRRK